MSNKVKFGLKNVHYAVITNNNGVISFGATAPIPGAVNLSLSPKGDKTEFYADDMAYFVTTANQGYEGNLEIALIPDEFRVDVLGDRIDANGALFEDSNAIPKNIALMYEFKGDKKGTRHVNYNVSVARPSIESSTKGASIEPITDTLEITASPAQDTGLVKGRLLEGQTGYDTFYSAVYLENEVLNTVASSTAAFSKAAPDDIDIDVTSGDGTNAIKDVKLDGVSIGGVNLTVTGVDVSIASAFVAGLDNGVYTILVEFNKGNAVAIKLTVAA